MRVPVSAATDGWPDCTCLLVANGELALRLPIALGERLQIPDRGILEHRDPELHVGLGVLVAGLSTGERQGPRVVWSWTPVGRTYVDLGVIRQSSQRLVQRRVHLLGRPLEESPATWTDVNTISQGRRPDP